MPDTTKTGRTIVHLSINSDDRAALKRIVATITQPGRRTSLADAIKYAIHVAAASEKKAGKP